MRREESGAEDCKKQRATRQTAIRKKERERERGGREERRGRLQEIVLGARREFSSRFGAPLAGAPRGEPGARKIKASPPLGMPLPSFPPAPWGSRVLPRLAYFSSARAGFPFPPPFLLEDLSGIIEGRTAAESILREGDGKSRILRARARAAAAADKDKRRERKKIT